ncbi:MAG: hypothetical protein FWJ87_07620 [Micromonosporaceae bacterium]
MVHPHQPTTTGTVTTRPPRRSRRWPWIAGIAGSGLVGLVIGLAAGAGGAEPTKPDIVSRVVTIDATEEQRAALEERAAELEAWEAELDAREQALTAAEEEKARNTVTDGIWTVGVDIEPGTYRATDVSPDCYWAILVSGTNGEDIVANDLPGGGNPTVTLQEGQDFETHDCGEWTRR